MKIREQRGVAEARVPERVAADAGRIDGRHAVEHGERVAAEAVWRTT